MKSELKLIYTPTGCGRQAMFRDASTRHLTVSQLILIATFCLAPTLAAAQSSGPAWRSQAIEGGYQLLAPPNIDPAHPVTMMVGPPEARAGSLTNWLDQSARKWAADLAATMESLSPVATQPAYSTRTMIARMQSGRRVAVYFVAYETPAQRRLLGVIYEANLPVSNAQVAAGIQQGVRLARDKVMRPSVIDVAAAQQQSNAAFGPPNVERSPWLRVGRGIGDDAVQFVLPHVWCGAGYRGYACTSYVYIFLKDGRVFNNVYASPRDFDPAAARGQIDEGRWRSNGGDINIAWSTGSQVQESIRGPINSGAPAPVGSTIEGRFSAGSARSFLGSTFGLPTDYGVATNTFVFRPDGTFEERSAVGSYGAGGPGASSTIAQGRYRIEQFTIEFAYADGRRDNRIFSVLAVRGRQINAFVLGDHAYGRD